VRSTRASGTPAAVTAKVYRAGQMVVIMKGIGAGIKLMARAGWCMRMGILMLEIGRMIKVRAFMKGGLGFGIRKCLYIVLVVIILISHWIRGLYSY
jgi:hypothetical protein